MQEDQLHKEYGSILLSKFSEKKYKEVIAETEKLMKSIGDSVFGYSIIGNSHFNLKNYNDSIFAFEKEIELAIEKNYLPYFNLARSYQRLGDIKLAEKNYKISYSINPENFSTNSNLASLLLDSDKLLEAEEFLYNSYRLNEFDPPTVVNLTSLLHKNGRFSEGLQIAKRGIIKITDHYQLYYNYALLLYEECDFELSYQMNEKALVLIPKEGIEYFDSLALKASNLTELNKPKEAIDINFDILRITPDHYGSLKNLSKSFTNIGHHRESLLFNRLADGNIRFEIDNKGEELFLYQHDKVALK